MEKKILVVDDDVNNLEIITELLDDEGYEVVEAGNGQEGLETLEADPDGFNLIILDWMMPVLSGIDLLKMLKQDQRLKDIPVIMQTAKAYSEDMVEGIEAGACQYLTKPFSKDVLLSLVRSTLAQHSKFDQLGEDIRKQKEAWKGCAARILKRHEDMRFDLNTHQIFNEFFLTSLQCRDHDSLVTQLLETVKKFSFPTSGKDEEDRKLRCSVRLAGNREVDISDRGLISSMDKLILQRAMDEKQVVQRSTYSAIPSRSSKTAILLRNTPGDEVEAEKAIDVISILLERFEERLNHFEDNLIIATKNKELEKKNSQIRSVIQSCCSELHKVNQTYQEMKSSQMAILEQMADALLEAVAGLDVGQQQQVKEVAGSEMIRAMDLYSKDQITDQKFMLTIDKLRNILEEKFEGGTSPHTLGGEQDEVDSLLASLGL